MAESGSAASNNRREWRAWYFYDFANSAFSTTVAVVFFGPYLTVVTKAAADGARFVYPIGIPVRAGSFFSYVVSLSVLLQITFLPLLGALADYSNRKKLFLGIFAYFGAGATCAMFFVQGDLYLLGGLLFLLANLSFGASIVFYNAFLPEIASAEERDRVSSRGWAMGFAGGGILLLLNLLLFTFRDRIGISTEFAVRVNLASAGIWWAGFSLIPLMGFAAVSADAFVPVRLPSVQRRCSIRDRAGGPVRQRRVRDWATDADHGDPDGAVHILEMNGDSFRLKNSRKKKDPGLQ